VHSHDQHTHRLLTEIEGGEHLSQRSLAKNLGIALGLTNLILRRLIRKGWVRMIHIRPNRVSYLLTPTGIAEKARMSRDSLQYSIQFYAEARERIRDRFAALSAEWPEREGGEGKQIVFFGTGEVAEIGYVCLQETDLHLVAAINDHPRTRFFDVPLYPSDRLSESTLADMSFGRLVVMSFNNGETIDGHLDALGLARDKVFWI
jgi:DNA-binding MarR family transcriptional regulator